MRICVSFRTADVNPRRAPQPRKAPRPAPESDKVSVHVPNNPNVHDFFEFVSRPPLHPAVPLLYPLRALRLPTTPIPWSDWLHQVAKAGETKSAVLKLSDWWRAALVWFLDGIL